MRPGVILTACVALVLGACGGGAAESGTTAPIEVLSEQATSTTARTTSSTTSSTVPTTTTTTTERPTTTTLVLLSDQEWPDLWGRRVERSEPLVTTFEQVKTWINATGYLMNEWGSAYSVGTGSTIPKHWIPLEMPAVGERPPAPLIAPALFEAALFMCDGVTRGEDPDMIFAQVVVDWRDYPWPEDKEQSFFLVLGALSMAGMNGSLCPQNGDVLIGEFLKSQIEALNNNTSIHFVGFAHPEDLTP